MAIRDGSVLSERRAHGVLAEYEIALSGARLSTQTRRAYRSRVAGYLSWLTTVALDADPLATPVARDIAVRAYRSWLTHHQGLRPATVNAVLTALDHFYEHLRLGKAATQREPVPEAVRRALPPDAQHRLLRVVDEHDSARDRAVAYTLLFTGVRVAELVRLDGSDLLLVPRQERLVVRQDGTGRQIPLHHRARPALQEWLTERADWSRPTGTQALFLNRRGGRLSARSVDELVAGFGERAGLNDDRRLTPQVLRHTFGENLIRAGADLLLVASLMGHKRLDTTRRYAEDHTAGRSADAARVVERAYA
ncbi:MAG TPA: tyrosine-type recombinase/integrase [Jiangellales bacterium]|nr:tyrosine-type recombinase/integrase [Jiangellales bacterium]